ncbi:MAG: hypothetical protein FWG72_01380 [Oscillospiraceae bacterium]|nr:hypothetical protein [Oscillospiraceae bacterium]
MRKKHKQLLAVALAAAVMLIPHAAAASAAPHIGADASYEEPYGLIFDAATGKLHLNISNSDDPADPANLEYTGQTGKWSGAPGVLRLDGFVWDTRGEKALTVANGTVAIELSAGSVNRLASLCASAPLTYGLGNLGGAIVVSGEGELNVTGGPAVFSSYGAVTNSGIILDGGTLRLKAGESAVSRGFAGPYITVNKGVLSAAGDTTAMELQWLDLPDVYTYWASPDNADPGGAGITYVNGGVPFTVSPNYKFVKIQSPPAPPAAK